MSAHPVRDRVAAVISALALLAVGLGVGLSVDQASAAPAPAAAVAAAPTSAGTVVMVTPCRVADSRNHYPLTTFYAYTVEYLGVGGTCGVPVGVAGVILSITAVPDPWFSGGWLTLWPEGVDKPNVSQVTFGWQNTTTEVTVKLSPAGWVGIYNGAQAGSVDVIVDVAAYIN